MDYSLNDPWVLDVASRRAQAEKILRAIGHCAHACGIGSIQPMRCVDIGCSSGVITRALAPAFQQVIGVDVDRSALRLSAPTPLPCGAVSLAAASGMSLPFADESFDVAVCNQVYQYVPDVPRLFGEI